MFGLLDAGVTCQLTVRDERFAQRRSVKLRCASSARPFQHGESIDIRGLVKVFTQAGDEMPFVAWNSLLIGSIVTLI